MNAISPAAKISPIIYGAFIVLLFVVLFTEPVNGATSWFEINDTLKFQPSEFAKLILILTNAKIFSWYNKKYPKRTLKNDIKLFLIIIIITSHRSVKQKHIPWID